MRGLAVVLVLAGCSPPGPDPAQLALGEKVYAQHCAACPTADCPLRRTTTAATPEIRAVLAFIESRWSARVRKLRAEMLKNRG